MILVNKENNLRYGNTHLEKKTAWYQGKVSLRKREWQEGAAMGISGGAHALVLD